MIHKKHLTPEFWLCLTVGITIMLSLWPNGDGWTRTGCVMLGIGAGLLGWTRPWEYNGRQ